MAREDEQDAVELPIDGVLDLHAFAPRDVAGVVGDYLDTCLRRGLTELRIIHGKGRGNLRRTVHAVLDRADGVIGYRLASDRSGWGATLVTLRPRDHD